jgi:hypothetical protein
MAFCASEVFALRFDQFRWCTGHRLDAAACQVPHRLLLRATEQDRQQRPRTRHARHRPQVVGSEEGGKTAAIACTLIETARLDAGDPDAWLADTFTRTPDYKIRRVDDLLPWPWNPQQPDRTATLRLTG